jgi:hypothetical protein
VSDDDGDSFTLLPVGADFGATFFLNAFTHRADPTLRFVLGPGGDYVMGHTP